jgi:histo-blood group ABO system transferase
VLADNAFMRIGLIVIATGKYHCFVPDLWSSVQSHFLSDHEVTLLLFADHLVDLPRCRWFATDHEPWPGPTLHRYRTILRHADTLATFDFLFYIDADMRVIDAVGDEILGNLVATIHPGFAQQPRHDWTYERRPQSRAWVAPDRGEHYYCGGFQGGRATHYLWAAAELDDAIRADEMQGVTAVWHDESHWNRYLVDHPPDRSLPPEYCWPEGWSLQDRPRISALNKDHALLRGK